MNNSYITNDYLIKTNVDFENIDSKPISIEEGEVAEATVKEDTSNANRVHLEFENGESISVEKNSVKADVGKKISVEIKENNGGKLVIKQVDNKVSEKTGSNLDTGTQNVDLTSKTASADYRTLLSKINVAYTKENATYARFLNENNVAVQAENIKSLAEIKKNIDYIVKNADENIISKIEASGIDTGKLSPDVLSKFVFEIKNNDLLFDTEVGENPDFAYVDDEKANVVAKKYIDDSSKDEASSRVDRTETSSRSDVNDGVDRTYTGSRNEFSDRVDRTDNSSRNEVSDTNGRINDSSKNVVNNRVDRNESSSRNEVSDTKDRTNNSFENGVNNRVYRNENSSKNKVSNIVDGNEDSSKNEVSDKKDRTNNSFENGVSDRVDRNENSSKNEVSDRKDRTNNSFENGVSDRVDRNENSSRNEVANGNDRTNNSSKNEVTSRIDRDESSSRNEVNNGKDRTNNSSKNEVSDGKDRTDNSSRNEVSDRKDRTNNSSKNEVSDKVDRTDNSSRNEVSNRVGRTETSSKNEVSNRVDRTETSLKNEVTSRVNREESSQRKEVTNQVSKDKDSSYSPVDRNTTSDVKSNEKNFEYNSKDNNSKKDNSQNEISSKNDIEHKYAYNNQNNQKVDIEKIQKKYQLSDDDMQEVIKNIIKADVPINEKNVEVVASAYSKAEKIDTLDDKTIFNLIKNDKDITIKNIYIAEHTSKSDVLAKDTMPEKQWEQLKPEVLKLFKREGIEQTKENIDVAKTFIENDIPITKENIEKVAMLKDVENNIDLDKVAFEAAKNIKLDKKSDEVDLFNSSKDVEVKEPQKLFEDYQEIIKVIPKINTDTIKTVLDKNDILTLENLKTEVDKDIQNVENKQSSEVKNVDVKDNSSALENRVDTTKTDNTKYKNDQNLTPEVITAKRQLAEIQLKLTTESALRLAGKGLDINVMPIKEAVEQLKELETEVYKSNLNIVGAEVSDENVQKMTELYDKVETLVPRYSNNVYREIITHDTDFTIDGINSAVNAKMDKIIDTFDTFATVPSQKFGDTFATVSDQLAHVLELNDIIVTDDNIDAAKILSLNDMDITSDNILQTKEINFKVSKTYNNLHPIVAAEMIKDGLNPVDMNIDDVISYIDKFDDEYSQDSKSQIAENILKVVENNQISNTEKEAVVSVYRMLDMVSKHSSAAIGTAIKNNVELTLGNLMEASKVFEKTKSKQDFDVEVNDNFGTVEDVVIPEKNIRASIQRAVNSTNQTRQNNVAEFPDNNIQNENQFGLQKSFVATEEKEYSEMIFKEIVKMAEPAKVTELVKTGGLNLSEDNIEKVLKNLKKAKATNTNIDFNKEKVSEVFEQIKQISNSPTNVISWINKNNIPLTMSNFTAAAGLVKNPFKPGKDLEKFEKESKNNKIDFGSKISSAQLEELKNGKTPDEVVGEIIDDVDNAFSKITEIASVDEINLLLKQASNIKKSLTIQNQVNKSDSGFFQLPVRMSEGNIVNLNMYVSENGINDSNKTFMSFETESLGVIQVYMDKNGNDVSLELNSEYNDGAEALSEYSFELKNMLSSSGFNVRNIKIGEEKPREITDEKVFEKNSEKGVKFLDNMYEIIV